MKYRLPPVLHIAILIVSFGLSVSAIGTIVELWHKRDVIVQRQADLNEITGKNKALQKKLIEAQSESYVERVARDTLGLVKEGESIVILPQNPTSGGMHEAQQAPWRMWLDLFL